MAPASASFTLETSMPKTAAACRWRAGFAAPVKAKTLGAVTATETPSNHQEIGIEDSLRGTIGWST